MEKLPKNLKKNTINENIKHAGRPSKKELYKKERIDIMNKLNNILELNDKNNFILYDIEHDEKKVQEIMDLKDDISKYFKGKRSVVFIPKYKDKIISKSFLGLIKIVYKEMDYNDISMQKYFTRNNKSFYSTIYFISKENILNTHE
jgi:hypothetical protein